MDLQKSKHIIQMGIIWASWNDEQKEAMRIALESIEKQIPKKVTEMHEEGGFCPKCHMHNLNVFQYCNKCGQRFEW